MSQCTAKSKRSGKQCLKWAMRGKTTCHMHGGCSRGPRTQAGKERARRAALKHGGFTKEAMIEHRKVMRLIKTSKNRLHSI